RQPRPLLLKAGMARIAARPTVQRPAARKVATCSALPPPAQVRRHSSSSSGDQLEVRSPGSARRPIWEMRPLRRPGYGPRRYVAGGAEGEMGGGGRDGERLEDGHKRVATRRAADAE